MLLVFHIFIFFTNLLLILSIPDIFLHKPDKISHKYGPFSEKHRKEMLEEAKKMFYFGYDNYMKYAYPLDELDPIHCTGRGPDYANPSNININDVLGDYSLTLVDALDTLAMMGNSSEFKRAVGMIIENLSFDKNTTVQVFEATIRLLAGLLSAHLIIKDPQQPFGDMAPPSYNSELLHLAHDLASRLLMAFENTATGIPYPRVNLIQGVLPDTINETCTAGAGTLLLEFGLLSHLLGDPVFDGVAKRSIKALWKYRSLTTGLVGNVIDIQTGQWIGKLSGLGAGLDSFYEYLLKAYIMFGDKEDFAKFNELYSLIKQHMRKGRNHCNRGTGDHPLYVNINMANGAIITPWIDSLQAAFSGVQVLTGDIEEAICAHAIYYSIWQRYGALPERYNWKNKIPEVSFYPLRPELIESTYLLYQATKNPFYLHVGRDILNSLNNHTKVQCGYATIHDVQDKSLEDRMESFFLSETCKYLYLLFDKDNPINKHSHRFILNTEGHIFPMDWKFRQKPWKFEDKKIKKKPIEPKINESLQNCHPIPDELRYFLPIRSSYLQQVFSFVGLEL